MNRQTLTRRMQSLLATFGIVFSVIGSPMVLVGTSAVVALTPHEANAQVTTVIASIPDTIQRTLTLIKEGLITAGKVGVKNAIRAFLEKIAYDTAVFIASAGENQTPLISAQGVRDYLGSTGDAAVGEFLNTLASQNGFINLNLCDLPVLEAIQIKLILPRVLADEPKVECTFSEIKDSLSDYADNFADQWRLFLDDPSTLIKVSAQFDDGNNALSQLIDTWGMALGEKQDAEAAAAIERSKSDFQDLKDDISNTIKTPSDIIGFQVQASVSQTTEAELTLTDDPLADALMVFTRTLASKLLERIGGGIISFFTSTDISDSLSGNSSTAASGAGVAGAREQFASFKTAAFNSSGTLDILTQFAACPDEGADVTNCIIDEGFRLAIEEQLTVKQALDQGLISNTVAFAFDPSNPGSAIEDPEIGIPYRSIEVLKQYNVVPVGWVLAAEYMKDFDGNSATLQQLVDNYDNCDPSDYSPYCGLIDPDWTLKAPEAYCKIEGYGETIASQEFVDTDGSDYTPQANLVNRLSTCLDTQSCLSEDENGSCEAYGYCTQQEAIYQFEGTSCPAYMASCEQYSDADGNDYAYLSNTLNSNDCSSDNAGCQWYCAMYNDVDDAFQCATQTTIYPTCTTSGGCSCVTDSESCTIAEGGFQCTTASGTTCTGTPVPELTEQVDAAISFDNDVAPCDSSEAGCTEFIIANGGANLLMNSSFEHFNGYHTIDSAALLEVADKADTSTTSPYDDTFGFYGVNGQGAPCSISAGDQECYGWQLIGGARARVVSQAADGGTAIQLDGAGTGYLGAVIETGHPLANRTFFFSYQYQNDSATECTADYWVRPNNGALTPDAISTTYSISTSFLAVQAQAWTFDDTVTESAIRVGIDVPSGCNVIIDSVKLEENSSDSGYSAYGESNVLTYVNMNETTTCGEDEVGCELYTPVTGESDLPVPGMITNPLADACGNGSDYSDPSCSQCEEQYVGCDAYIPVTTAHAAPINTVSGFSDPTTIDTALAEGIAERTGYYCEGTATACSPERAELDCGSSTIQCLPSISIIPSTGTQCSVANVGCEEYVNLEEQAAGGEGLEYYSYIRQCVKPNEDQIAADAIDTFYTFEGSDITGYQIRSWYLKQSNLDEGPCTNLDLFGSSAQTTSADCIDTSATQQICDAADVGVNPDCTEYYDDAGAVFYRLASATITVSDSCEGLRNTLDDRIYYSIPDENTTCPASANMCREYKGSEGEAVNNIIDETFDTSVWTDGESSSTVITASTGQSMAIGSGTTNGFSSAYTDVSAVLDVDTSYVVTFWAKASDANTTLTPYFESGTTVSPFDDSATLSTDWKRYQLGPVALSTLNGDEVFGLTSTNSAGSASYIVYIDNVILSESHSQYLIAGSASLCDGYEGCEQYTDTANITHYLKSFTKLCDEDVVGCASVIATQHSNNPFYEKYNTDNEYIVDDVPVLQDEVMNVVVTDAVLCDSTQASCMEMGVPDLDAAEKVESFTTTYLLNDPDNYDTTLCQDQQRSCEEFTDSSGSTVYFKAPGDKYCTYNSADGEWQQPDGTACPLQNSDTSAAPSQPKGAICNGGIREGELCTADIECPDESGTTFSRCVSNLSDDSGWVGQCDDAYVGCTLYVDPNPATETTNSQFEADVKDNGDLTSVTPDNVPDDWNILNDGDFGTPGPAAQAYTVTDVTNAVSLVAQATNYQLFTQDDFDGTYNGLMGTLYPNTTSVFVDSNSGNPSAPSPLIIGFPGSTTWAGWGSANTIRITSDNTTSPTLVFTMPAVPASALVDELALFYVDTEGGVYWADSGNDGVKVDFSDFLSPRVAMRPSHVLAGSTATTVDVNGFYDASQTGGLMGCTLYAQVSSPVFDRENAVQLQVDSANYSHCMVGNDEFIPVDENATYTLSGDVYIEDAGDEFALGVLYYDADYKELGSSREPKDYAIAAYEGPTRNNATLNTGKWMRFHGVVGPNLAHSFPEGTYYARVFIEAANTGTTSSVYFDNIQFGQNQEYTYIASTVDGSGISDTNSCNGEIDIANGCVAFRDATSNDLGYLSSIDEMQAVNGSDYSATACTFNDGTPSEACDTRMDSADSNVVLKVQNDRQCAEWLTCIQSRPNYDSDGNITSTTCLQIGRCSKRNEDTGECIDIAPLIASSAIGYDDDISAVSQPGNVDSLNDIEMLSGYSTAGAQWESVCSDDGFCVGAGNDGTVACTSNADCADVQTIYGYYTPENMPQQGSAGAVSNTDLVPDGDFEAVYCNGEGTYETGLTDLSTGESLQSKFATLETKRDKQLTCTLDAQCRTTDTESKAESIIDTAELNIDLDTVYYSEGWCNNVDPDTKQWDKWDVIGDATMMVIDYADTAVEGVESSVGGSTSNTAAVNNDRFVSPYGSGTLDLNNVMLVSPEANAEGGVRVDIGNIVADGQSYVLSFDAQYMSTPAAADFIQVGLAHGDTGSTSDIDYFEQGTTMADIVFVVDASSSMASYITNVASATSSLVSSLSAAGVNYQTSIVTTGGTRSPRALDFSDYTDGEASYYGAADGVSTDFTADSATFAAAMSYIAGNLDGGAAYNYEALVDVASGTLQDGHELNFRSGAKKFVILLTDVGFEDATYADEQAVVDAIDGSPYVLNVITLDTAATAYDQLVDQYGGEEYDITATDYTDIFGTISTRMTELLSEFRFSTTYQRYTLGPITISHKSEDTDTTRLFISQVAGSSNVPFVIDNVSLLPALEVNKENSPSSDNSSWLISRDCRAYPEDSAVSCDYQDEAGTFYQGWKGYCLQHDTDISSTGDIDEGNRCVAWWPVDVIAGEPDNVDRDKVVYSGKTPVYSCLVAKGNAAISVCANTSDNTDGLLCSSDSDCTGGVCVGDSDGYESGEAQYTASSDGTYDSGAISNVTYSINTTYAIADYVVRHNLGKIILDAIDPDASAAVATDGADHETAFFHKFSARGGDLPVESSIHISEIDDIHFFMGTPDFTFTDPTEQAQEETSWHAGTADFNLRADLQTQTTGKLFKHDSLFLVEQDPSTAEGWFYQCRKFGSSGDPNDPDCMAVYSSQKAAWCNGTPCTESSTEEDWNNADFTFVKAIMPKTEDSTLETYIDSVLQDEVDPFTQVADLNEGSTAWSANGGKGASGTISTGNEVNGHTFSTSFFQSEESQTTGVDNLGFSGAPTSFAFTEPNDTCFGVGSDACGANIVGVKFDFENGFLKNVYLFYWAGLRNIDPPSMSGMYWEFALNEPCLLAVQTVDDDANTIPWMTRVSGTPSYTVEDVNMTYHAEPAQAAYGSIGLEPDTAISEEDVVVGTDTVTYKKGLNALTPSWMDTVNWPTSAAGSLPTVGVGGVQGTGIPFACIGACNASVSMGDDGGGFAKEGVAPSNNYHTPSTEVASQGLVGVYGTCSDSGNYCSVAADGTDDCTGALETCDAGDWSNKGTSGDTYYEQLKAAAQVAWQRYRLLFPTLGNSGGLPLKLGQSKIFFAPRNADVNTTEFGYTPHLQVESVGQSPLKNAFDSDTDGARDFEDMSACSDARDTNDYCYVKPTVTNVTLNSNTSGNITLQNGAFASLQFDSAVDVDQQPLKTIRVEWLGDPDSPSFNASHTVVEDPWDAAPTFSHVYTYAYTCDPTSEYWNSTQHACQYEVRVQIQDNWGICSGDTATSTTRKFAGGDECTSYTAYSGKIYVKP